MARHLLWESGCLRGTQEVWLCCDEKGKSRVGVIHLNDGGTPELELTSCKVQTHNIAIVSHFIFLFECVHLSICTGSLSRYITLP